MTHSPATSHHLPATLKIAWRDARSAPAKFLFVILAVAVGVGALTGVRSFSRAFHNLLLRQARTLMAGDISLRVFGQPTAAQTAALDGLERRGVREHPSPKPSPWPTRPRSPIPCWFP